MQIFDRPLPDDKYGPDDRVNLGEVLAKVWARKRLIFVPIVICAGLAFVIAKLVTPIYNGDALVTIKQPSGSAGDPSVGGIQIGPEAVQTEAFVLQSRALASETIERLHLDRDPEFDPSLRKPSPVSELFSPVAALFNKHQIWLQPITDFLSGAADIPEASADGAGVEADKSVAAGSPSTLVVNAFMKRLQVTMLPHSNVIQVSFKSSRRTTAAAVPNTLIGLYLQQRVREKDKTLEQESERLDKGVLPKLREKMHTSEIALADYRRKSGLIQNPTVLGQELSDTKAQLAVARARTAEAAARLNQFQTSPSPGQIASIAVSSMKAADTPVLQRLREQEVELQGQLAALRGSLGANHPKMLQLEAQLKDLKDTVRREEAERLKVELSAAQVSEAALSRLAAELTDQFAQTNGGDTQLQSLIGEADADRKTYEEYLARSNEIHSNMNHAQPDASLVSHADVPLTPSFPVTIKVVITGMAIGAGVGVILAAMMEALLRGLRSKEQVEDSLRIKCLGLLPRLKQSRCNRQLSPLSQPQNAAFEQAIRSVQIKLLGFGGRDNSRVFLVAAALPNEGKSWVAASLAASLAADGFSTALVDCDLHRPSVHRMFDGPRGPGLTDYFAGSVALDEIVYNDRGSGVNYVPVGTASPTRTCRITSDRLRKFVDQLGEKYAFIILDSAPVLAVSETILLSQIAQMTIFVAKWGSTPPAIARQAVMLLLESGGAETGVLLSMVDTKRAAKYGDPVIYKKLEKYHVENPRG